MSVYDAAFVNTELSKPTSIFGLRLWVVIGILVGSLVVLALFLLSLCLTSRRNNRTKNPTKHLSAPNPPSPTISKEIQEILPPAAPQDIQLDIGKLEHRVVFSSGESRGGGGTGAETASFGSGSVGPEVSHLGWGRWYTLRELEAATNGLCEENVIGEGGYCEENVIGEECDWGRWLWDCLSWGFGRRYQSPPSRTSSITEFVQYVLCLVENRVALFGC